MVQLFEEPPAGVDLNVMAYSTVMHALISAQQLGLRPKLPSRGWERLTTTPLPLMGLGKSLRLGKAPLWLDTDTV
eukprot:3726220-Pyramimonas_sp.AAC.1